MAVRLEFKTTLGTDLVAGIDICCALGTGVFKFYAALGANKVVFRNPGLAFGTKQLVALGALIV